VWHGRKAGSDSSGEHAGVLDSIVAWLCYCAWTFL
jgi:hypothetical protein